MQSETKQCQNCKQDFVIESEDFQFYEKIDVPPPTRCPECRYIRRLLDRNEYNFYKRQCDATGESIISIYRPDAPFPVYKQEYWKSDAFDALSYGRDFDFSRPFFEQYEELRRTVPHLALVNSRSAGSEYTNQAQDNKDCYMLVTSGENEKCMYGSWNFGNFLSGDCYMLEKSEFCYECVNMSKCSRCAWCQNLSDCVDVYFSSDCRGCSNCFGSAGLRNKQYYWFNEDIGKEEYEKRIKEFEWSNKSIREMFKRAKELRAHIPVKYYHGVQAHHSSGDYIENTEQARLVFNCRDNKDTAYMQDAWRQTQNCRDCTEIIVGELSYEIQGTDSPYHTIVARSCFNSITDCCYCDMCFGAQNCFGCFGLKQKQYCILNKQYSKEEYASLKEKIVAHMKKTGEWGEYFPPAVSPFAYNESMAQDYFPLTREDAVARGYSWYDRPATQYPVTLSSDKLQATISETSDDITKEVIGCKTQESGEEKTKNTLCVGAFRLVPLELMLYKKLGIPVPEYCFPCRRAKRFELRNPRKLWHRECMCDKNHPNHSGKCANEFETSYAPDKPEIVYCEQCYQAEVV